MVCTRPLQSLEVLAFTRMEHLLHGRVIAQVISQEQRVAIELMHSFDHVFTALVKGDDIHVGKLSQWLQGAS